MLYRIAYFSPQNFHSLNILDLLGADFWAILVANVVS